MRVLKALYTITAAIQTEVNKPAVKSNMYTCTLPGKKIWFCLHGCGGLPDPIHFANNYLE